jgi:hypothetical protein
MSGTDEIVTAAEKKLIVKKLLEIVNGDDQKLAYRAITRILEIEKRNNQEAGK